jgi:hypothetical protein
MLTGYGSQDYADSFSEFGMPLELPHCKGWVLKRPIFGTSEYDAMGCYPLFACEDWSQLPKDLEILSHDVVALSLVTDPFGRYSEDFLKQCFVDVVKPFKRHFVTDLSQPFDHQVSKHHIRNVQKALHVLRVERCEQPAQFLEDWIRLYSTLIERHKIRGMTAFSRDSFARQLNVDRLVAFRAVYQEQTVGMLLWYVQGDVGYYHLGAHSPLGYQLRDSFALFKVAIEYFTKLGLRWLNLGAGAGLSEDGSDGLTRFKRGWATGTRIAYFCGRIFDQAKYQEIVRMRRIPPTDYFPAYRRGEF